MRVAVIDLGSNSIRLLVKDLWASSMATVHKELATTRLGRGVVRSSELDRQSMADTLSVIAEFISRANSMGTERFSLWHQCPSGGQKQQRFYKEGK